MKRTLRFVFLFVGFCLINCASVAQWIKVGSGMGQIWTVQIHPTNQQIIYAGSNTQGMYKTTDGGTSWTQVNSGLLNTTVQAAGISRSNPSIIYCGTSASGASNGVYVSTNDGTSWTLSNTGITEPSIAIQAIAVDPTNPDVAYITIFDGVVNATNGVYKTTDRGANWSPATTGIGRVKNFLSFAMNPLNPNTIYLGSSFAAGDTEQARIYKTTDAGATWHDASAGLPPTKGTTTHDPVRALSMQSIDTNKVLAGVFCNESRGGAYVTTNGGNLWIKKVNGLDTTVGTLYRSALIEPGSATRFYVGLGRGTNVNIGIFRSTNAGQNWLSFNNGAMLNTYTIRWISFRADSSLLYAGGAHPSDPGGQGVFRYQFVAIFSSNRSQISFPPTPVGQSRVDSFVVRSQGNTPLNISATSTNPVFTVSPGSISIPEGDSARFHVTFTPDSVRSYAAAIILVHNGASSPDSVTVLGNGLTGVAGENRNPKEFVLGQNYPNPFNPTTQIKYSLPKESFVRLTVFNILGQEVATLVSGEQAAGYNSVAWDGRDNFGNHIGSGIYFYRLEARPKNGSDPFIDVKKMILIK